MPANAVLLRTRFKFLRLRPLDGSTPEGRADERHRRVVLSVGMAALAKGISVGTALISVPLTLQYLGVERYGMWVTMISFITMLSFADFGMGNGLLNAVASANGEDDRTAIRGLISSAFIAMSGLAVLIGFITAIVYPFVSWPSLFNSQTEAAAQEAGPTVAVFLACFVFAIPLGIVQKVQVGLQQGFSVSLWQCGASLLALAGLLLVIHLHGGLPWLVLAVLGGPLLTNTLNTLVFFGAQACDISPSLSFISRHAMMKIVRLGMLFLIVQIVIAAAYNSDNLIVAQLLGASRVAELAIPAQMFGLITTVLGLVLTPLWPAYGEAITRGDHVWVKRTLLRSFVLCFTLAALASTAMIVATPYILKLWVGKVIEPPFLLVLGLGAWRVVEAAGTAIAVFLNGANAIRLQAILGVPFAIAAITLKIVLVPLIGVGGVPWATITAYSIIYVIPFWHAVSTFLRLQRPVTQA
jgi:O-antigen/teichoic acid export membrane protein